MKKMKGAASQHPSSVFDDSKIRFKHQTLLQDYHELEKVIFVFCFCGFPDFFVVSTRSSFSFIHMGFDCFLQIFFSEIDFVSFCFEWNFWSGRGEYGLI